MSVVINFLDDWLENKGIIVISVDLNVQPTSRSLM